MKKITSIKENENFEKLIIWTMQCIQNNLKYYKNLKCDRVRSIKNFFEYLMKFVKEKTIFDHNLPNFQYFSFLGNVFNSGFQAFSIDTLIDFSFLLTQLTFPQFLSLNPIWGSHFWILWNMYFFKHLAHWNFEFIKIISIYPPGFFLVNSITFFEFLRFSLHPFIPFNFLKTFLWQKPLHMLVTFLSKKCLVDPLLNAKITNILIFWRRFQV